MVNEVKKQVYELLNKEDTGHGNDHIDRVLNMSLKFAEKEGANKDVVALIALLHDVDDYKLVGEENAKKLTNAKNIMNKASVSTEIQNQVLDAVNTMGYSKSLKGIRPSTIEGKIVSDADMCDALGVNGILRTYKYSLKSGKPFFDRNIFPTENMTAEEYKIKSTDTSVCHIFEKILKLKDLMMTGAGKDEATSRHQIIIEILYHLFEEENAPEWTKYLNEYLNVKK